MNKNTKNNKTTVAHYASTFVQEHLPKYLDFVSRTLDDGDFVSEMEMLLPFDGVLDANLRFVDSVSPIKSMGVSVFRMDIEPSVFALGVNMSISQNDDSPDIRMTEFVTAAKTHEELRIFVKNKAFLLQVEDFVMEQIKQQAIKRKTPWTQEQTTKEIGSGN